VIASCVDVNDVGVGVGVGVGVDDVDREPEAKMGQRKNVNQIKSKIETHFRFFRD